MPLFVQFDGHGENLGLPRRGKLRFQTSRLAVFESVDTQQALQVAEQGVEFVETFAIGEMLSALATLSEQ